MRKIKRMQAGDVLTQLYGRNQAYSPVSQQSVNAGITVTGQRPQQPLPSVQVAPAANIQNVLDTNLNQQLQYSTAFTDALDKAGKVGTALNTGKNLFNGIKNGFSPANLGSVGLGLAGSLAASLNPGKEEKNSLDAARNKLFKNATGVAAAFGPIGAAIGIGANIIDATGGFTDTSKGLGGGNDALNFASSLALPGAGYFTKKIDNYNVSDRLGSSSGYTGTASTNQNVSNNIAGRKILFGRGRAKDIVAQAQNKDRQINSILNKADDAFASAGNTQLYASADQLRRTGNSWISNSRVAKDGAKLEKARAVIQKAKKFAEGGKMNVIPEGALHAHKHHLEEVNPDLEGITKKGIPVVSQEDGGMVQHAEVEREEIIFTMEVTKELERLRDIGTDEAAKEAGMFLSQQIIENTIDNTDKILNNVN